MTPKMKPKKIKPVRPVPVLAWTLCDSEGNIMPKEPKGPACGHIACSQNFIDTGSVECVEGETDGS